MEYRSGYYCRTLITRIGKLELQDGTVIADDLDRAQQRAVQALAKLASAK